MFRRRANPDLVSALALTAALATPLDGLSAQREVVERAVAEAEGLGARTGVAAVDDAGTVLYRHRAAEAFAPASNMKLLTAAAVLAGLGADHKFVTRFALEGGALVVHASGDPNWIRETEHAPEKVFAEVARALRARGVNRIRDVVLRDGAFTGPARPPSWPQDQLYTYYCAPTGPFVLEQGVFWLSVAPGSPCAEVALLAPPAGRPLRGSIAVTSVKKDALYGAIDEGDAIRVRGKVWQKAPRVEIRTAVNDPGAWYRDTLLTQLARGAVRIDGAVTAADAADGVVLDYATPLQPALQRMLEDSSNFDAEQCLRVLGAHKRGDGSLQGGVDALRDRLVELLGELPPGVQLVDGSGLSRDNRLTPGALLVTLFKVGHGPRGEQLLDSLPVAGRSGTLDDRFVGTDLVGKVVAKTGWIMGASSLSGVVTGADGRRRWFSILMSYGAGGKLNNKQLKALQERIVAGLSTMVASG
ncbi:MAG: D-alanyl-D-alanine carboxypeptidase/D-alanyl-D-alanine-endopeptidase [Planctomycetes bacterium]|nr:D-alanyl-D-alanine carboxypeptidase/D-alanyl-D-alanine-endopeptidase [Planctomycetota bacterium]